MSAMEELLPYQFEPEYSDDEEQCPDVDSGGKPTHEPQTEQRIGNIDWCTCGSCSTMETVRECPLLGEVTDASCYSRVL